MPTEPNNNVEQQLKAYAQERRRQAGEPFTLPTHTRRILQDEVRRLSPVAKAEESGASGDWWDWCWPYIGLGASALAALMVCFAIWRQDHPPEAPRQGAAAGEQMRSLPEPSQESNDSLREEALARGYAKKASTNAGEASLEPLRLGARDAAITPAATAGGPVERPVAAPQPMLAGSPDAPVPGGLPDPQAKSEARSSPALEGPSNQLAAAPSLAPLPSALVSDASSGVALPGDSMRQVSPPSATAPMRLAGQNLPAATHEVPAAVKVEGGEVASLPPRAAPQADTTQASFRNAANSLPNQLGQRYVQSQPARELRRNFNSPPRKTILNNFVMQPQGDRVQVIDEDGSVYEGTVRLAGEPLPTLGAGGREPASKLRTLQPSKRAQTGRLLNSAPKVATVPEKGLAGAAQDESLAQNLVLFHAVGTNRSLKQKVVFDGRLVLTNGPATANLAQQPDGSQQQPGAAGRANAFQELLFNNAVIQGRATIGGRTQLEINAVQAGR